MAKNFAQCKGQRAERAVIDLLQPVVTQVYTEMGLDVPKLQRNTLQSDGGGYDIVGLDWLALEVKHQETLHINQWWSQCVEQSKGNREPVLFYKQNNVKFKVMMRGLLTTGGAQNVRCPVEVSVESFLLYFEHKLKKELME